MLAESPSILARPNTIFITRNELTKDTVKLIRLRFINHFLHVANIQVGIRFIAGSFKSQLIDYFRGHIVSWKGLWQIYVNKD